MTCPHCEASGQHDLACLRCGKALYSDVIDWLNKERGALIRHYSAALSALRRGAGEDSRQIDDLRSLIRSLPENQEVVSSYDVLCLCAAISAGPFEPCYCYPIEDGLTVGDFVRREVLRPFERVAGFGDHFALLRVANVFPSLWPGWRQVSVQ